MIDHIYTSKCSNTGGVHPGTVNEYKLRESRAAAALHLSQILEQTSRRASITAEQIAAIQPRSEQGSVAEYESTIGGGVTLLDDDVPTGNSMQGALAPAGASKGESTPTKPAVSSWPTLGEAASIGSTQENSMIEGLDTLHIGTSNGVRPPQRVRGFKSTGWADTPFSENKPTPVKGEWTAPTMPDYRKNFLPSASGPEKLIRTDWDFMKFERHGVDNNFHCPFVACGYVEPGI